MNCIWKIKKEERNCQWCVVLFCKDRKTHSTKTITTTNNGFIEAEWSNASIMENGNRLNN